MNPSVTNATNDCFWILLFLNNLIFYLQISPFIFIKFLFSITISTHLDFNNHWKKEMKYTYMFYPDAGRHYLISFILWIGMKMIVINKYTPWCISVTRTEQNNVTSKDMKTVSLGPYAQKNI